MDKRIKKRLIIGTIVLLIIANISALVTIYFSKRIENQKIEAFNKMQEQAHKKGMHKFFKDELKLTDEQFNKFREMNSSYFNESREIARDLDIKRHDMMHEISKLNPDAEYLEKIAKDIGNLHYELKKITIAHFLKLKEICNEEQQIVLQKMFMYMIHDQDFDNERGGRRNRGHDEHGRRGNGNRENKHGKRYPDHY